MQRGVPPSRVGRRGARFVAPAGSGRHGHPLAREHARVKARISSSARVADARDPVAALRRAARSLTTDRPLPARSGVTIPQATVRWTPSRRQLRDPRSSRAVPWPG